MVAQARIRDLTRERKRLIESDNEVRPDEMDRFRQIEEELSRLGVNIVPPPV